MPSVPFSTYYMYDGSETVVEEFIANKAFGQTQDQLAESLNYVAEICAANADCRGFHDEELIAIAAMPTTELANWLKGQLFQAEVARFGEEAGELVAAIRKPHADEHLPEWSAIAMELADIVIRVMDSANKRGIDLGQAIIQKLVYNASRPYKHGKNS